MEHWLIRNFKEVFGFPDDAIEWLVALWRVIQAFDDLADGDHMDRDSVAGAVCAAILTLPSNRFYVANSHILNPLLAVAILKWRASDDIERSGKANATSFAWRAGYYDIVLAVVQIIHGMETALKTAEAVLRLYGENFDEYIKEFHNA